MVYNLLVTTQSNQHMLYVNDIRAIRAYFSALNHSLDDYSDAALKEILFQYRWTDYPLSLDAIYRWEQYDSLEEAAENLINSSDYFDEEFKSASIERKNNIILEVLQSLDYSVTSVVENGTKYWLIAPYTEEEKEN